MPSRGRKRFVSEGDGGLVKETSWSVLSSCWLSLNFGTSISHVLELAYLMFNIFQVMGELGKKRCWLFVNNFHSEGKAYVYQWSRAQWRSCFQKWYRFYILFAPENGSVSNFKGDSNHCVATELVNISDYFVKDLAKVVFPDFVPFNYCKIETNCDPTKFDFEFYCIHTIVYILVIVHRILKVYQNWTEFIITHESSCEKKLYLEIIKTNVVYSAAQKSKIGISAHISELYTRQCLVLMVKIRRETILDNDIRTCVLYMSENWKYSSVPT